MLRSLALWLLLGGLALVAWDATREGPRPPRGPQTMSPDGGTGWPTPPIVLPLPSPSPI
jgi:hypothetical protein